MRSVSPAVTVRLEVRAPDQRQLLGPDNESQRATWVTVQPGQTWVGGAFMGGNLGPDTDVNVGKNYVEVGGTSASAQTGTTFWQHATTVGVQMNLPLFAGFATQNRIRETVSLSDKARQDLEATRRSVTQTTKSAYLNLASGLGQVNALEAAEDSSQLALDANIGRETADRSQDRW